jgi:hypothetical protein
MANEPPLWIGYRHLVYRLELLTSIAQLIDPRRNRKANYVLPAIGLKHPALMTKLLDIIFNVLRCNEHHPKEQFMKIWVTDCEGGYILLELLKLASQPLHDSQLRHLDTSSLPRQLQQLRFPQSESNGGLQPLVVPLGPSVKKRVETILESFFEFGPENEGFGPFFGERHHHSGNRSQRDGYGSDVPEDDADDDLEDDEYNHHEAQQQGGGGGHHYGNGYRGSSRNGGRAGAGARAVDFDIDDMEDRVSRMNLA